MSTDTIFGPQGLNASLTLPSGVLQNRYGVGTPTWVQDCSAAGSDGTQLNAAFFNTIIGNLRELVTGAVADGATFEVTDGDMTLVYESVKFLAAGSTFTAGDGTSISAANVVAVTYSGLASGAPLTTSRIALSAAGGDGLFTATPYELISSVLVDSPSGFLSIDENATTGQITFNFDDSSLLTTSALPLGSIL